MSYELADGSLSTDYKVGDKFKVIDGGYDSTFVSGIILEFLEDDETECPSFKAVGEDGISHYEYWHYLVPYQEEDEIKEEPKFVRSCLENTPINQLAMFSMGYKFSEGQVLNSKRFNTLFTNEHGSLTLGEVLSLEVFNYEYKVNTTFTDKGVCEITVELTKTVSDSERLIKYLKDNYCSDSFGLMVSDIMKGKVKGLEFTGKE